MDRIMQMRAKVLGGFFAAGFFLLPTAGFAQFHAVPDAGGDTIVIDANGLPVEIAPADPVGVRPGYCPPTAFYVYEVQTDKTELVVVDCLTGEQQYTVDMLGSPLSPSE
jgi:hypothetical protein